MDAKSAASWLKDLIERAPKTQGDELHLSFWEPWLVEAETALHSIFGKEHPIFNNWSTERSVISNHCLIVAVTAVKYLGVIQAAHKLVEDNRLSTLKETIVTNTIEDVLEQAEILSREGYFVASAVLAGGALETHLKYLAETNSLTIVGNGSIEKYKAVLKSTEVITKTEAKEIDAWGGRRNDAAHDPTQFQNSVGHVECSTMISGIRGFISKNWHN